MIEEIGKRGAPIATDRDLYQMIHWEESQDIRGFDTWLRLIDCGHWGFILTAELPRWIYPLRLGGIAQAHIT